MQSQTVPARAGTRWVALGFQTFWRHPIAWSLITLLYTAISLTMNHYLTADGMWLTLAITPYFMVMTMVATGQSLQGRRLTPALLRAAAPTQRKGWNSMLLLSAAYVASIFATKWLAILGMQILKNNNVPQLHYIPYFAFLVTLTCSLTMLFLHAPGLVRWHGTPALEALVPSARACLRNWRAFLVLNLAWLGLLAAWLLFILLSTFLLQTLLPEDISKLLLLVVLTFSGGILGTVMFISAACSFSDCFSMPLSQPPAADY